MYRPCTVEFSGYPCVFEQGHPGAHFNRTARIHWTEFTHREPEPRPAA